MLLLYPIVTEGVTEGSIPNKYNFVDSKSNAAQLMEFLGNMCLTN